MNVHSTSKDIPTSPFGLSNLIENQALLMDLKKNGVLLPVKGFVTSIKHTREMESLLLIEDRSRQASP